jgi:hypothetical protein
MNCQYCNKTFTSKYTLLKHQKTTKRCLELQHKIPERVYNCDKCDRTFIREDALQAHMAICKVKVKDNSELIEEKEKSNIYLKEQIKILQEQNNKLQEQLNKLQEDLQKQNKITQEQLITIASKEKTVINNTQNIKYTQNILNQLEPYDLNEESIKKTINEHLSQSHISHKYTGLAKFAVNFLLKKDKKLKMVCVDQSRNMFVFKDENNNIYKDPGAARFIEMYISHLPPKISEIRRITLEEQGEDSIELTTEILSVIEDTKKDSRPMINEIAKRVPAIKYNAIE